MIRQPWLPDPGRTGLYRLFDASGTLIYIGIATKPEERIKAHRWEKPKRWRHDIATHSVEWFDTRIEAGIAEKAAIRAELPVHNRRHHPAYDDAPWSSRTKAA